MSQLKAKQGATLTSNPGPKVSLKQEHLPKSKGTIEKAKWDQVDLQENYVGLQAQNLYLVNYLNKLEFLLEQCVKDRKRDKKARERKFDVIVRAINERIAPGKAKSDDQVLKYCK